MHRSISRIVRQPQVGDLYRWPGKSGWCRHGMILICESRGQVYAEDTYWGSTDTPLAVDFLPLGEMEFVINLSECRKTHRDDWEKFLDADRAYIPVGGGSEQYWVRRSARPDVELTRRQISEQIVKYKADIRYAQRVLERLRGELSDLSEPPANGKEAR